MENEKIKNEVFQNLQNKLFPPILPQKLILKIFALLASCFAFTLTICPQFGLGTLGYGHYGLSHYFMLLGHNTCQVLCGFLLTSLSILTLNLFLKPTEKEWILNKKTISYSIFVLIVSSFFWMLAPHIYIFEYVLWLIGSLSTFSTTLFIAENHS